MLTNIYVYDVTEACVSKPASVKVFKEVFIKMHLPYSLNVMEQANIKYTLFNYGKYRKKVRYLMPYKNAYNLSEIQFVHTFTHVFAYY